jgi:hypothetical protein
MQIVGARLLLSATDLVNFLGCRHGITWLQYAGWLPPSYETVRGEPSLPAAFETATTGAETLLLRQSHWALSVFFVFGTLENGRDEHAKFFTVHSKAD